MSDKYYVTWMKRFAGLALFNLLVCGFNGWKLYTEIVADKYSQMWFTAFLIFINLATAIFMGYRVWQLNEARKEKMWGILSTPENQIW